MSDVRSRLRRFSVTEDKGWRRYLETGKEIWQRFIEDRMMLAAAGIAFYITLSVIPLAMLMISAAAFFIDAERVRSFGRSLTMSFGPGIGDAIRGQVLSVVRNRGLLTGISLVLGLWVGSQVFVIAETALNQVWDADERRPVWVRRGLALAMVVVIGLLLLLAVAVRYLILIFGELDLPLLGHKVQQIPWLLTFLLNFVLPWLLVALAFLVVYKYLPAANISWKAMLPGALIASLLWVITLQIYSWYVASFGNYEVLYGSLGGLVLLMIWFNYSAVILLLGAEISSAIGGNQPDRRRRE